MRQEPLPVSILPRALPAATTVEALPSGQPARLESGDELGLQGAQQRMMIVIIDRRALTRDCLARSLRMVAPHDTVLAFGSVEEWLENAAQTPLPAIVVLCTGEGRATDPNVEQDILLLARAKTPVPTVLLSDLDDPQQIRRALSSGARGYIPTSLSLDVAVQALHLIHAGGVFAPADSLFSSRLASEPAEEAAAIGQYRFTPRQAAVVSALRTGKANKVIAFELNMTESTVKVHVRNIMKKLKAKNRTEVAFLTNRHFPNDGGVAAALTATIE